MANTLKLTKDNRGRWRRQNLGQKRSEDGRVVPCTFLLGTDYEEACKRVVPLERVWEAVEQHWQENGPPLWKPSTHAIALAVARGEREIIVQLPPWADSPNYQAAYFAELRERFPFLNLAYADPLAQVNTERVAERLERDAATLLDRAQTLTQKVTGTLYEALDAYLAFVTTKYEGKNSQRPEQRIVSLLKQHSEDMPLDRLDADAIDQWLAVWCKRPEGKRGRLALTTCRNVLKRLRGFIKWLDRSREFGWEMPRRYSFTRCRVDRLPADRVKRRLYFKRPELLLLWEYANSWDRAMIVLALNCGFSKREIATLQKTEIVQKKAQTFIQRYRTKTDVYGEWELWPETLEALNYLAQRPNDTPYVVVNEDGQHFVRRTAGGNENQSIKNRWDRLIERVKKDNPEFHVLPFKCLRKTGSTYIRKLAGAEVSVMYIAHGEKADGNDPLLHLYATRPWRKVHKALGKLRKMLLPILTSVKEPWTGKSYRTSPKVRKEVLALRQGGKSYKEIGEIVGLHYVTVGKMCRQEGGDSK